MSKTIVDIKGMHCKSCEITIEDELLKVPGVEKVIVSESKGTAEIFYTEPLRQQKIIDAIIRAGYALGKDKKTLFSKNLSDYIDIGISICVLAVIYFLANTYGLFNFVKITTNNYASLYVVLLVGLVAGFSTCMALVGGLVLGASARFAEKHPNASLLQKFKPHLSFNLGRIVSFLFFGSLIGYAGSIISLSPLILGLLTIIVGGVMLLLGTQLTEISPKLSRISITLPKFITRALGIKDYNNKEYSHTNSIILGATTFFLPCGFTQAMQLYAISTGDPIKGAMTMGFFALGTTPGLLGIGGLTSVVKGAFAKSFFKFAGVVVIVLALLNISNGYNLTGLNILSSFSTNATSANIADPNVVLKDGVQIVKMTQNASGYTPNTFTIRKGIPVKWVITSEDVNSCSSSIISQALNVRKVLNLGENIIEFTPTEVGTISFSCSMGMYTGVFNVVGNEGSQNITPPQASQKQVAVAATNHTAGGGCGCGGGATQKNVQASTSISPAPAIQQGDVQLIKTAYTQANDIQPNKFAVKSGQPVRMEIDASDDGSGCMAAIKIPGLVEDPQLLKKDTPVVFNFTPTKAGDYLITCAMGVPRGIITVL